MAKEFRRGTRNEDLFAAMPPLEALKLLLSWAVTESIGYTREPKVKPLKLGFIDI